MICKVCKTLNEDDSKYCISCGSPLIHSTRTCPNGHIYDALLPKCPYCPSEFLQNKMGLNPGSHNITSSLPDNSKKTRVIADSNKGNKTKILGETSKEDISSSAYHTRKLIGWLVTYSNREEGEDYRLYEGRNLISSTSNSDIVINDPAISSPHCLILYRAGKLLIKDELSTNGTYLNGDLIEEAELKDNDIIKIGKTELKIKIIN